MKNITALRGFPAYIVHASFKLDRNQIKLTKTVTLVFALFQQLSTLLKFEKNLKFINSTTCENILALHMGFHYIVLLNVSKLHW